MEDHTHLSAPLTVSSVAGRVAGLTAFLRFKGTLPHAGWHLSGEAALTTSGILLSLRTRQRPGVFDQTPQPVVQEFSLGQLRPGERAYRVLCDGILVAEGKLLL